MAAPTKGEIDELKDQFETLRGDVSSLVSALGKTAKGTANRTAEDLSEEITRLSSEIRDRTESAYADTEKAVTNNPVQALLIALGVGFLIGALTRR